MFGLFVFDFFLDDENVKCEDYYIVEDNVLVYDWVDCLVEFNGVVFGNFFYSCVS